MRPEEKEALLKEARIELARRGALAANAKRTPEQRTRQARRAAKARWAKHKAVRPKGN